MVAAQILTIRDINWENASFELELVVVDVVVLEVVDAVLVVVFDTLFVPGVDAEVVVEAESEKGGTSKDGGIDWFIPRLQRYQYLRLSDDKEFESNHYPAHERRPKILRENLLSKLRKSVFLFLNFYIVNTFW